jgi:superfamily II DNA or RNA helicase
MRGNLPVWSQLFMKLSSVLSSDFDYGTRSRGAVYFRSGAVRIKLGSAVEVSAKVRGSQFYEVEIGWDEADGLTLWCACPYFDSNGPCKHLWATILAAEAKGFLSAASSLESVPVSYDLRDEELDDDEPEYDEPTNYAKLPTFALAKPEPKPLAWRQRLDEVSAGTTVGWENWPSHRDLLYVVDVPNSLGRGVLFLKLMTREPKRAGGWKKPAIPRLVRSMIPSLPEAADRHIVGLLSGVNPYNDWMSSNPYETLPTSFRVLHPLSATIMPLIAGTGRAMLQLTPYDEEFLPLAWEEGEPWRFRLRLTRGGGKNCALTGSLRRGDEEMDLSVPVLVTEGGFVFTRDRVARLEEGAAFEWMSYLRKVGRIEAPDSEAEQLLAALIEHPSAAPVEVPEELRYQEVRPVPKPCLTIRAVKRSPWEQERLRAQLAFDYEGRRVADSTKTRGFYDPKERIFFVRDTQNENASEGRLLQLGFSREWEGKDRVWALSPKKLPGVVRACLEAGWHIEAEGKTFRRAGAVRVEVLSGVDWFELHGAVDYGETSAKLPALLAALRRGENMVQLDDGTYGLLPEEWLNRFGALAGLGTSETDHVRFRRNQAGLLDALLAAQPEVRCDEAFARVRDELRRFEGIRMGDQPAGFSGQLRDYQREGVGWMEFLRRFGFGGCLADDMGVGKTAQVLALLEARRALRAFPNGHGDEAPTAPSLVVVPKSLVFNWKQEAARFTPQLRVLDHTGVTRDVNSFVGYDLILTTYGTLRRDALEFKDIEFDYIVLDEAQAIKNASTESAKAVRLLRGRNRLALSGTPVENHLGELWSLFEFLNPGMLGAASVFKLAGGAARNPSEETRQLLAHALRPFILRRTKQQVARELPAKSEQTIFCELEPPQRKLYNELRAHYRNSLLNTIATQGLAKSKIQVLEALLRLRQAACHPGLLDAKRLQDPSAKLEMLMEHLGEVAEEGHKALVFSQFTSLLAIVRERLDAAKITYEYLDGATRDRQQRVERFQNDPDCRLFLISLKAGGLGLNLTAAEYVFLLDPWWNPAVEAQAVDRAHRIGQTRQVFAYRLIAKDTVEEKVLQLQNSKRDLAAAIISEDNSPLSNLRREDLELLLS